MFSSLPKNVTAAMSLFRQKCRESVQAVVPMDSLRLKRFLVLAFYQELTFCSQLARFLAKALLQVSMDRR